MRSMWRRVHGDGRTHRGLITSDGSMMLTLKRGGQHRHFVLCWIWQAEADTGVSMILKFKKGRQTPLVWCWIWLREKNSTFLYGVQYDWKRQTLPSYVKVRLVQRYKHCRTVLWRWVWLRGILSCRVVLNTHWGKHCCLVLCWIRPRGKVRWKHVKRWWEGCLDVAGTNSDVTEKKKRERERGKK